MGHELGTRLVPLMGLEGFGAGFRLATLTGLRGFWGRIRRSQVGCTNGVEGWLHKSGYFGLAGFWGAGWFRLRAGGFWGGISGVQTATLMEF